MGILIVLVYSMVVVISATFGYVLNEIQLFFIVVGVYAIYRVITTYKKGVVIFLATVLSVYMGALLYYYRQEHVEKLLHPIRDFLNVYYYSVRLDGYYINTFYQAILMGSISLILFFVYHFFYRRKRLQGVPIILGFGVIFIAFFSDMLTSSKDYRSFIIFVIGSIVYYFAIYASRNIENIQRRQRYYFYGMGIIFAIGIVGSSMLWNHYFPSPFEKKVTSSGQSSRSGDIDELTFQFERTIIEKISDDTYQINDSFEHEGIALFSVKANTLKYYMTDSYDIYQNGIWTQSEQDIEPVAVEFDDNIHTRETVEITYGNIRTNRLLVSPYWDTIHISEDMQAFFDEEQVYQRGFNYTLEAVIPKYRTNVWKQAIMQGEKAQDVQKIEGYMQLPEQSERIQTLATEITSEATTNYEKARQIEAYLSSTYTYNEKPQYLGTSDMVQEFLFEAEEGFCQQFASSMVLMMRSVGIPSRFVVGYVLDMEAYEDIPDSLMYSYGEIPDEKIIYDHNAHAWVESYFPGVGWVQFEPTAGQSFYSSDESDTLDIRQYQQMGREGDSTWINRTVIIWVSIGVIIVCMAVGLILLIQRRYANRTNYIKRLLLDYQVYLLYVQDASRKKEPGDSIREFIEHLYKELPSLRYRSKDFLETLEKAFYNRDVPTLEEVEVFEQEIQHMKTRAKRRLPVLTYYKKQIIEMMTYYR